MSMGSAYGAASADLRRGVTISFSAVFLCARIRADIAPAGRAATALRGSSNLMRQNETFRHTWPRGVILAGVGCSLRCGCDLDNRQRAGSESVRSTRKSSDSHARTARERDDSLETNRRSADGAALDAQADRCALIGLGQERPVCGCISSQFLRMSDLAAEE